MGKQIDYVVGKIYDLEEDRIAGWSAYFASDKEKEELIDEIADLKAQIKKLKARKK